MADKYINGVGLQAIKTWIEGKFGLKSDLDALDTKVEEIIAEGGEPNVIETVKVNGTALTPDAQKAVDVEATSLFVQGFQNGGGRLNVSYSESLDKPTFGLYISKADPQEASSPLLAGLTANNGPQSADPQSIAMTLPSKEYVDQNGGKIDTISVNGTQQTITNKNVDIIVPTDVSDLANDSGYQTASDVQSAINTAVASAYKYKGSVATYSALPSSGQAVGDVWDVQDTGVNYAWTGTEWDDLGPYVDTSVLWTSVTGQTNTLEAATVAEINAILNA